MKYYYAEDGIYMFNNEKSKKGILSEANNPYTRTNLDQNECSILSVAHSMRTLRLSVLSLGKSWDGRSPEKYLRKCIIEDKAH